MSYNPTHDSYSKLNNSLKLPILPDSDEDNPPTDSSMFSEKELAIPTYWDDVSQDLYSENEDSGKKRRYLWSWIRGIRRFAFFTLFPLFGGLFFVGIPFLYDDDTGGYFALGFQIWFYYQWAFFIWALTFDFALPGMPIWFLISAILFHGIIQLGILVSFYYTGVANSKLHYFICGGVETLLGFLIYGIFVFKKIVSHRRKKASFSINRSNDQKTMYCSTIKCWSDDLISMIGRVAIGSGKVSKYREQLCQSSECQFCPSNLIKQLLGLISFKLCLFCVWMYLLLFTHFWNKVSTACSKSSSGECSGKIFGLTVVFIISRGVIGVFLQIAGNVCLPTAQVKALTYFDQFQSIIFTLFFYRNLFIQKLVWKEFVVTASIVFFSQVLQFSVRMTKLSYRIQYGVLKYGMIITGVRRFATPFYNRRLKRYSYHKHTEDLAIQFYSKSVMEYYTIFTFCVFLTFIRFSLNRPLFPSLGSNLSDNDYTLIMFQMCALVGAEFISHVINFTICHFLLKLNRNSGTKKSILTIGYSEFTDNRTLVLRTFFVLHLIHDVYYGLLVLPENIQWLP